jgi:hypothetical protein
VISDELRAKRKGYLYAVRCEYCEARVFDSSAPQTDDYEAGIEVWIKCWKCKTVGRVYLAIPIAVGVGVRLR